MNVILNADDLSRLRELELIRRLNFRITEIYAKFLNIDSAFIKADDVKGLSHDCSIPEPYAYAAILAAAFGLDDSKSPEDRRLLENYMYPSIKLLSAERYRNDPYYKNIVFPEAKLGGWELKYESYKPYEGFIYDDTVLLPDFSELPPLGFFNEEFRFPAVLENGREWMCVTPNEVETLSGAIAAAHGKTMTFGLGLGYFAYMAARKNDVSSVTVVERNKNVIELFREFILPQFPEKDKIRIVHDDAFEYAEHTMPSEHFDYALDDIWHDVSDGFGLWLKMKKLEHLSPGTSWDYWIERALLSRLRWLVFDTIRDVAFSPLSENTSADAIRSFSEIEEMLSDTSLRRLALSVTEAPKTQS